MLFPGDSILYPLEFFVIYKSVAFILGCKAFINLLLMLPHPSFEITGYPGVEYCIYFISKNVNIVDMAFH